MAWTTPKTFTAGELVGSTDLNPYLRDNMNQTAPAKSTAAGQIFYASSAKNITALAIGTSGQVLQVTTGGIPAWATVSGSGASVLASGYSTLADGGSTSSTGAWVAWGSTLTYTNPSTSVSVLVWGEGYVQSQAGSTALIAGAMRVRVSFSGGSSYTASAGPQSEVDHDLSLQAGNLGAIFRRTGTPTGDIKINAQKQQTGGSTGNVQFKGGTLMYKVFSE